MIKHTTEIISDLGPTIACLKSKIVATQDNMVKNQLLKQIERLEDSIVVYKITTDHGIRK